MNKTTPKHKKKKTQMQKLIEQTTVSVVIVDDFAYWVQDNCVYKAAIENDKRIKTEESIKIDVFSLSEKETKKLMNIIDSMSEL